MNTIKEDFLIDLIYALEAGDFILKRNEINIRELEKYLSTEFARDFSLANSYCPNFDDYAPVESGIILINDFEIVYEFLRHDLLYIGRCRWWYDKKDCGVKLFDEYLFDKFLKIESQIIIQHTREEISEIMIDSLERYITGLHLKDSPPEYIFSPIYEEKRVRKHECLYTEWRDINGNIIIDVECI